MANIRLIFYSGLVIMVMGVTAYFYFFKNSPSDAPLYISNLEECVSAGYPVLETYPRQCRTPDGKTFRDYIVNAEGFIKLANPQPNQIVISPLTIEGEARGPWFFEAVFPVKLMDENGKVLAQGNAQAQGDWMVSSFVPFKLTLDFSPGNAASGTLVLENDNPSGLSENAKSFSVPVLFKR